MSKSSQSFHLIASGDILPHDACINSAYNEISGTHDFSPMFSYIKDLIITADLAICNLETTISGKKYGYSGYPRFNAPETLLLALKNSGFNALTTANNHSFDFGEQGILSTIQAIKRNSLIHIGTSENSDLSHRNVLFKKNGITLGINSYTYGTNENQVPKERPWLINMIDFDLIETDINYMRNNGADIVIICLHAGEEYLSIPDQFQISSIKKLRHLGADIILGNHSHVVQPVIECPQGKSFIIFSLGNLLSNQRDNLKDTGIILDIEIGKNGCSCEILSVNYHPTYVHRWERNENMNYRIIPLEQLEKFKDILPDFPTKKAKELLYHIRSHIKKTIDF